MIQTNPERRELRAYDILEDGSLGPYIVLHQFGEDHRGPQRGIDGMCLDAEGNIVATAGSYASGPGPMIYVWDPRGRVLETHPMPVGIDSPTNCTFGDPDQRTLYVTTGGGHLFRARHYGTTRLDHLAAGALGDVRKRTIQLSPPPCPPPSQGEGRLASRELKICRNNRGSKSSIVRSADGCYGRRGWPRSC